MVQLSATLYCLIATLATPGFATSISDVTSGANEIASRVAALNTLFNTIPVDLPANPDTVAVCCNFFFVSAS